MYIQHFGWFKHFCFFRYQKWIYLGICNHTTPQFHKNVDDSWKCPESHAERVSIWELSTHEAYSRKRGHSAKCNHQLIKAVNPKTHFTNSMLIVRLSEAIVVSLETRNGCKITKWPHTERPWLEQCRAPASDYHTFSFLVLLPYHLATFPSDHSSISALSQPYMDHLISHALGLPTHPPTVPLRLPTKKDTQHNKPPQYHHINPTS